MKNMKLNGKLAISFGLVLLIFFLSSGVAFISISKLGDQIKQYSDRIVPNTERIWVMRRNMVSAQRNIVTAIAVKDQEQAVLLVNQADKDAEMIFQALDEFRQNTKIEAETIAQLSQSFDAVLPVHQEISAQIKNGEKEKAFITYETQFVPLFDSSNEILIQISDRQNQLNQEQDEASFKTLTMEKMIIIATILIAILVVLIVMSLLRKAMLTPIKEINTVARSIAKGDLNASIRYDGKDEFGELANEIQALLTIVVEIIKDIDFHLGEMGAGNFTETAKREELYVGDFASLLHSLEKIRKQLSATLVQIDQAAQQVASGSEQVSSSAQALSQGATEQASSIEELSASIAEVTEQIRQNADNAKQANQSAHLAGREIVKSNEQMKNMVIAMEQISNKSAEISKIIKVIEDIAFQTNILALNAAVEAARAGTVGKGFAVVADEVRNLASKSADAAKITTSLIEETIVAVSQGSTIASDTANYLNESETITKEAVRLIERITEASERQATAASEINVGIEQISSVVQTNSATAEESAAASEELSAQADMLQDLVSQFKL